MKWKTIFNKEDATAIDKKKFNTITLDCPLCLGQFKISTLVGSVGSINLSCGCKLSKHTRIDSILYSKLIVEDYLSTSINKA
jgi:hypothetical protein